MLEKLPICPKAGFRVMWQLRELTTSLSPIPDSLLVRQHLTDRQAGRLRAGSTLAKTESASTTISQYQKSERRQLQRHQGVEHRYHL